MLTTHSQDPYLAPWLSLIKEETKFISFLLRRPQALYLPSSRDPIKWSLLCQWPSRGEVYWDGYIFLGLSFILSPQTPIQLLTPRLLPTNNQPPQWYLFISGSSPSSPPPFSIPETKDQNTEAPDNHNQTLGLDFQLHNFLPYAPQKGIIL